MFKCITKIFKSLFKSKSDKFVTLEDAFPLVWKEDGHNLTACDGNYAIYGRGSKVCLLIISNGFYGAFSSVEQAKAVANRNYHKGMQPNENYKPTNR